MMAAVQRAADSSQGESSEGYSFIGQRKPDDIAREKEDDARRTIAIRLVWAYMGLLFLSIIVPVSMLLLGVTPSSEKLSAIRELSTSITGGISSVTGVIGFVLGYYFKSEEAKKS